MQKSLGYGLTGDTRYECMFFYYGATTRNGKGTLMESTFNLFHEDDFCIGGCKVDINPIKEEKTGSLAVFLQQAAYFMESEMAFSIADRYIYIQDATEGYDYTIYDSDFTELDGGVYDNPENSIYETLDEIKDVQEAIALWKEFQDSPLKGIPSIGILVHCITDILPNNLYKFSSAALSSIAVASYGSFFRLAE